MLTKCTSSTKAQPSSVARFTIRATHDRSYFQHLRLGSIIRLAGGNTSIGAGMANLVLLTALLVVLALLLGRRVLVLLVLRDEVVHVGLCLGELHFVHTLTGVPVEEGLATEHRCELL